MDARATRNASPIDPSLAFPRGCPQGPMAPSIAPIASLPAPLVPAPSRRRRRRRPPHACHPRSLISSSTLTTSRRVPRKCLYGLDSRHPMRSQRPSRAVQSTWIPRGVGTPCRGGDRPFTTRRIIAFHADAHPRMRKNERRGGHVCRRARPGASRVWHVGCVGVGVCLILYRYNPLYIPNTNAIPIPVRARAIACTHRSIDHTHRSIDHIASSRATCDGPPSTVDESLSTAGERGGARPPPVVDAAVGRVVVRTTRTRCQPAP